MRPISPSPIAPRPSPSIPRTPSPITIAASPREKAGKIEDAIADYSTAIELDSGYRDAYANRAVLYDHKGEKERAIADYRAALAKNPSPEDRKDLEAALKRLGAAP